MELTNLVANLDPVCEADFASFVKYKLGKKIGKFHREIIEKLEISTKHLHVQASRGFFKTTIISICYPLWCLWKPQKRKLNIGIVSHSLSRSSEIMRLIKQEIMERPEIAKRVLPEDMHHAIWSATEIITKKGHRVVCVPPGGVQGEHFDLLILDDIQRDEDGTGAALANLKKTFWNVICPIVNARKGKMLVVGTPLSFDDLYSEIKENSGFMFMKYPAVKVNERGDWIESIFPEHYTIEDLQKIRDGLPSWAWQSQYMLNPIGAGTGLFPLELINSCIDPTIGQINEDTAQIKRNCAHYIGCDIALSEDKRADSSCFVVIRKNFETNELSMIYKQIPPKGTTSDEQVTRISNLAKIYGTSKVVIEQKGLGYSLAQKAFMEIPAVEKFDTTRSKKEQILGNVELLMRNKKLKLPKDDAMINELMSFGLKRKIDGTETFEALSGHDDQVMALALACYAAGGWTSNATVRSSLVLI